MSRYDALIKIQSELKAPKTQRNKFGGYKYRSCEDILEAVKPLLSKYNTVLLLSDTVEQVENRTYIKATATLISDDFTFEVSAYAREEESKKGMDASQITGSASSYARKYALNGLFAIDDAKDSDAKDSDAKDDDATNNGNDAKKEPEPEPQKMLTAKEPEPEPPVPAADIERLLVLAKQKGVTEERLLKKLLKKYNIKEFCDLTSEQYNDCYAGLATMPDAKMPDA